MNDEVKRECGNCFYYNHEEGHCRHLATDMPQDYKCALHIIDRMEGERKDAPKKRTTASAG